MANIDNYVFDPNYLLSEKPADGYYISASNFLPNHEPEILTQPNRQFFKTRDSSVEIKFYFQNHGKFYRPDIFCPFNLNGTGTPELKYRLQLSKSTAIPVVTVFSDENQGNSSISLTSTDALALDETNWITINGMSTKYWFDQEYIWTGGDQNSVNLVDENGAPLGLVTDIFENDNVYYNKLGDNESEILFEQEYFGVLPIYPWGIWTPYSQTILWGGYGINNSNQFVAIIEDSEYSLANSVYCGKLTITGGPSTGIDIMRLFIGQSTVKNAYLEIPFEPVIHFENEQAIDEINIKYINLSTTDYTLLYEMIKSVVLVGDDVLFYIRHAGKNYVFAGFIPKNEMKLTLKNSVTNCEAKYLNEWDFSLNIEGYK